MGSAPVSSRSTSVSPGSRSAISVSSQPRKPASAGRFRGEGRDLDQRAIRGERQDVDEIHAPAARRAELHQLHPIRIEHRAMRCGSRAPERTVRRSGCGAATACRSRAARQRAGVRVDLPAVGVLRTAPSPTCRATAIRRGASRSPIARGHRTARRRRSGSADARRSTRTDPPGRPTSQASRRRARSPRTGPGRCARSSRRGRRCTARAARSRTGCARPRPAAPATLSPAQPPPRIAISTSGRGMMSPSVFARRRGRICARPPAPASSLRQPAR